MTPFLIVAVPIGAYIAVTITRRILEHEHNRTHN